ncbi:MAG: NAD(P)/FAD-dependent oxidoreductase [Myxococcales bacterium]|nr:NAD(P)/FAD-dependent oxidoreductase [Myxococcales bacterium]
MSERVDVVIIGAGPGGACLATFLAQAGRRVLVLEKSSFPRFHIGESLTGVAGQVLEDLGLIAALDARQFPLKGGVKVIGQGAKSEFFVPVLRETYQVRRSQFDALLVERAEQAGAEVRRGEVISVLQDGVGRAVTGLSYRDEHGEVHEVRSRFVADASGQSIVLSRLGVAGKRKLNPTFDKQVALFTHVEGALRDPGQMGNNTFIFYEKLHHWAWFIPISPTVTSVGVVIPNEVYRPLGGTDEAMRWGLEHINPDLRERVRDRPWLEPVRGAFNYAYSVEPFAGEGWLCIGDAHGFVDPIFSFGVSIAMQEAGEASRRIAAILDGSDWVAEIDAYCRYCRRGFSVAEDLINYFWAYPVFFGYLMRGSMRRDIIRLLGSDIHTEEELPAIASMRRALQRRVPA